MMRMRLIILAFVFSLFAPLARADWQPAKRLTWTPGASFGPRAAVDSGGNLHLVWYDLGGEDYDVYYSRSTDGGSTWTAKKALTANPSSSAEPFIAVDPKDRLHVVWSDNAPGNSEIYYKKSTNGGATWSQAKRLTWTAGLSLYSVLAVDADALDNLLLVWMDKTPGNYEVYFKKSTDGGDTWSSNNRLTWTSDASSHPVIAVDHSNLHVVWYDGTQAASEVYYRMSYDYGVIWSPTRRLTWTAGLSFVPIIVISPLDFNLIWSDGSPGNLEIYYKKSTDGGEHWTANKRLTWTSLDTESPAAAIDAAVYDLHLVWSDPTPGSYEVYYRKCSKNLGEDDTWSPSERLTWNLGDSRHPGICVDPSGGLHIFWSDSTPGNFEIYYKRSN